METNKGTSSKIEWPDLELPPINLWNVPKQFYGSAEVMRIAMWGWNVSLYLKQGSKNTNFKNIKGTDE